MKKIYKIGYTTGVYDMFHIGHLNLLKRAKSLCDYLIVGVTTDQLCFERKKKYPIICEHDRMAIIKELRCVDKVVYQRDMDKLSAIKKYHANTVFVGSDWKGSPEWIKYEKEFYKEQCEVVYLKYTDGISSSILRERLNQSEQEL